MLILQATKPRAFNDGAVRFLEKSNVAFVIAVLDFPGKSQMILYSRPPVGKKLKAALYSLSKKVAFDAGESLDRKWEEYAYYLGVVNCQKPLRRTRIRTSSVVR